MPVWITAIGIGSLGAVYGYLLFYSFKRQQTPLAEKPLPLKEVVSLLAAIGSGGVLGGAFILLEGINYIGPYGIGLALGVAINVSFTLRHERLAETPESPISQSVAQSEIGSELQSTTKAANT